MFSSLTNIVKKGPEDDKLVKSFFQSTGSRLLCVLQLGDLLSDIILLTKLVKQRKYLLHSSLSPGAHRQGYQRLSAVTRAAS